MKLIPVNKKTFFIIFIILSIILLLNQLMLNQQHPGSLSRANLPSSLMDLTNLNSGTILKKLNYTLGTQIPQNAIAYVGIYLHNQDAKLGHGGEVNIVDVQLPNETETHKNMKVIAVGGGITSAKVTGISRDNILQKFLFFTQFIPSFCKTVTAGYNYQFYLAFDSNDPFFGKPGSAKDFGDKFHEMIKKLCPITVIVGIHMVQCSHSKKPAWAQNDAMMEAYLDNVDYFYRVNDDTVVQDGGWTENFISHLAKYQPPNIGVVGPKHSGGNTAILTYDFTHRTHVEVFGFYYPRVFSDWYADDWITNVYKPGRSTKLTSQRVTHTMRLGQRYRNTHKGDFLKPAENNGKKFLRRYINYKNATKANATKADGKKVIAMSLWGSNEDDIFGAIRNAQLAPIIYRGWTLMIFTPSPNNTSTVNKEVAVPERVISKLIQLGAEVYILKEGIHNIPYESWSFTALDSDSTDYVIIRNAQFRISDRESDAVTEWIKSDKAFHCMIDHPSHKSQLIVNGLWGAKPKQLRKLLKCNIVELMQNYFTNINGTATHFLHEVIWPKVKNDSFFHDSFDCKRHQFAIARDVGEYVGQKVNTNQVPYETFPKESKLVCKK